MKSLKRTAYKVERVARHQSHRLRWGPVQYTNVIGKDDSDSIHDIESRFICSCQHQHIADSDVFQPAEKPVTMAGDSDVPGVTRQRRTIECGPHPDSESVHQFHQKRGPRFPVLEHAISQAEAQPAPSGNPDKR